MRVSFHKWTNKFQIVSYLFAILCLLPVFLFRECRYNDNSFPDGLNYITNSKNVKTAQIFCFLPAVSMLVDLCFEWLNDKSQPPIIHRGRIYISLSLLLPNALCLILSSAINCCYIFQSMEYFGVILFYCSVCFNYFKIHQ